MGLHCPFRHFKHKLWPKERPGVKLVVWLPTTKSRESTRFLCVKMACDISLNNSQQGLQLCFRLHFNPRSLHAKLWRPKVAKVPTLEISGLPFGSPGTKSPMERCRGYYKGEGGGFPQVRIVMNLVCPCCPWLILAPKVFQLCTNHLMLVLCKSMWVNEAC